MDRTHWAHTLAHGCLWAGRADGHSKGFPLRAGDQHLSQADPRPQLPLSLPQPHTPAAEATAKASDIMKAPKSTCHSSRCRWDPTATRCSCPTELTNHFTAATKMDGLGKHGQTHQRWSCIFSVANAEAERQFLLSCGKWMKTPGAVFI